MIVMIFMSIGLIILGMFYLLFPRKAREYIMRTYKRQGLTVQDNCVMNKTWYYRAGGLFLIIIGSVMTSAFYDASLPKTTKSDHELVPHESIIESLESNANLEKTSNKSDAPDQK